MSGSVVMTQLRRSLTYCLPCVQRYYASGARLRRETVNTASR